MTIRLALATVALAAAAGAAPREDPANDCLIGVQRADGTTVADGDVVCRDGEPCDRDGRADGKCIVELRACVNLPDVAGCAPRRIKRAAFRGQRIDRPRRFSRLDVPDLGPDATFACGRRERFRVELAGGAPASRRARLRVAAAGRPARRHRDADEVTVVCEPCPDGITREPCLPGIRCANGCLNADGGPDRLRLALNGARSDLDVGWSGSGHNARVPSMTLTGCLTGCDGVADRACDVCVPTGSASPNGETFGPPVPVFAANVPLCLVHRLPEAASGTADEATGEIALRVPLGTDVFLTDRNGLCPQCAGGRCDSGLRAGMPCTIDASVHVWISPSQTDRYDLSSACLPAAPAATWHVNLDPLTTGASAPLEGPTPCTPQVGEPSGIPPEPDACDGTACTTTCTGTACAAQVDDPLAPGQPACADVRGGISQHCCEGDSTRACFPLANGGQVVRTGRATAPQPTGLAPYPKAQEAVLASTFCMPATGAGTIDSAWALPGPAALQVPAAVEWTREPR